MEVVLLSATRALLFWPQSRTPGSQLVANNAGGSGRVSVVLSAINTSLVTNAAPQTVHQTPRYGQTIKYLVPNLTPIQRALSRDTSSNRSSTQRVNACSAQ
jgi:hypothetical protein